MIELNSIICADCLVAMKDIPDKSIDLILADLPYGTTDCSWDTVIPFEPLWAQYKRIIKDNAAIVLTASQPFTSALVMSNIKMFKYCWVWAKQTTTGFQHAKNMPLKNHEDIIIFSGGSMGHANLLKDKRMNYNPQGIVKIDKISKNTRNKWGNIAGHRPSHKEEFITEYENYPRTILNFAGEKGFHPTQKPVALFEYLIKTYTNEGDTVLDNCAGSGTTGVACKQTGRNYILIEKEEAYCKIAESRLRNTENYLFKGVK